MGAQVPEQEISRIDPDFVEFPRVAEELFRTGGI